MEEKIKFVFNYTRVTNRAESIVAGSLIISSSFNHEFVVTYTNLHRSIHQLITPSPDTHTHTHIYTHLYSPLATCKVCVSIHLLWGPTFLLKVLKKTWMFDSLLSHLLKHLIKLKEILNFFVGTKLWGPARYSTFITYGNYLPYNILWGHTDLTCEVCVSIPYLRGPPLLLRKIRRKRKILFSCSFACLFI